MNTQPPRPSEPAARTSAGGGLIGIVSRSATRPPPDRCVTDHDAIALLVDLVSIPSVSGEECRAAQSLANWFASHGLEARIDEAGNALAIAGDPSPDARELILLGHIDTVPGWIDVRRDGDTLHGRGSVDAKGPLCAFAAAAGRVAPDLPPGVRIVVAGAVEEELPTSKGARHLARQRRPDACIIGEPSGWDGVTLGYKGRLIAEFALERPVGHSSRPDETVAEAAALWWDRLRAWAEARSAGKPRLFDRIQPGLRSMNTTSDGLRDSARAVAGFRLPPGVDPAEVEQACAEIAQGVAPDAAVRCTGHELAHLSERSDPLAALLTGAIRDAGGTPRPKVKTGTSDMNVVAPIWQCPIVAYGPGDSSLDHTPEERIGITEYLSATGILETALRSWAAETAKVKSEK